MTRKLIIDADPGISDAFAVLVSLVDPSIDVVGLTATAGSVAGHQATRNLQFLVDLVDPLKHPRIGQSDLPSLTGGLDASENPTRHGFYGIHGLGDVEVAVPELHNRKESAKLLVELVRQTPGEVSLLTLGPLTNVAAACDLDPEFPEIIQSIVCLGGADNGPGDITSVAEFNIWADPESAEQIFQLQTSVTVVPLNVSSKAVLTFEDVDLLSELLESASNGDVIRQMMQYVLLMYRQHLAFEGIPLHAMSALAVAARAERFSVQPAWASVETSGQLTRGMTVVDRRRTSRRPANIDVVTAIDEHGVVDYFSRGVRRAAR